MTEQVSAVEDQTELLAATHVEITKQTVTGSSVLSRGANVYLQCAVIVIGIVGTVGNALVLYALVASKEHRKHVLIFNQNVLDLVSCFFLVVTYAVKLSNVDLAGPHGFWICMTILSEGVVWGPVAGSLLNLVAISIARYLKVVHHIWSQKMMRNWMVYAVSAFSWIAGIGVVAVTIIPTTEIVNGVCYSQVFFASREDQIAYVIVFIAWYIFTVPIFTLCYWRILVAVRRLAMVMAGHGSTTAQTQFHHLQYNVIKTMILVCLLYTVTTTPLNIYYFLMMFDSKLTLLDDRYYAVLFISFFYICANPFIYATKFDPVKRTLMRLIPCNKTFTPAVENIPIGVIPAPIR